MIVNFKTRKINRDIYIYAKPKTYVNNNNNNKKKKQRAFSQFDGMDRLKACFHSF